MSNRTITSLPAGSTPNGTETFEAVQSGASVKLTLLQLYAFITSLIMQTITATSYTLQLSDNLSYMSFSNAGAQTITVPLNTTVAFPVGATMMFERLGAGTVTFVGAGGVTIHSLGNLLSISGQFGQVSLTKKSTDVWTLAGALA